jgi:hypothetical protein
MLAHSMMRTDQQQLPVSLRAAVASMCTGDKCWAQLTAVLQSRAQHSPGSILHE